MGSDPGWSCETQLLKLTTTLHTNLENRKQTDVIVLEFSKAFDLQDLKWNLHIGNMTSKGNKTLGFLTKNLRVRSKDLKEKACIAILRPKLEYCSTIWDPRKTASKLM